MLTWLYDYEFNSEGIRFTFLFGMFTLYRLPRTRIAQALVVTTWQLLPFTHRFNAFRFGFSLPNRAFPWRSVQIRTVGNWHIHLTPADPDAAVSALGFGETDRPHYYA